VSKRIGPSMSTEPGWMAARGALSYYFGSSAGKAANDPSMLLSFERPAPAGGREDTSQNGVTDMRGDRPALYASPRSLKTAQCHISRHR
jgi:hypothetical protein